MHTWDLADVYFYVYVFPTGSAANFSFFKWMRSLLIPSYRSVSIGVQDQGG